MSESRSCFPASLLAPFFAAALACTGSAQDTAPPGMKLIAGGSTKVGLTLKEVERLMKDDERMRDYAGTLIAATPQHTVEIPDFYLMVTEVTNEMYAAYVQATGAKPPEHWGEAPINEARETFLKEQGRIREEAKKQGLDVPGRTTFDSTAWWNKNWKGAVWGIPAGSEHRPVVFVNYGEAQGYARWAGLRLMTEFEYQRAVRGNTERLYPWGDGWDDQKYAATNALRGLKQAFPVGTFPEGASPDGIYDLAGNVWEWTSSPFVAFPKWKMETFTFGKGRGKEKIDALAKWDADNRVAVGGCYHNDPIAAWSTTRRNTERQQATNALGFRCAASKRPGVDMAETVFREDLPPDVRPHDANGPVAYAFARTDAIDFWAAKDLGDARTGIVSNAGAPAQSSSATIPPPGYGVIERYDYALFTPADTLYAAQKADIVKETVENAPVHIGFLSTNQPLVEPALQPGTYMVAYRGAGEAKKKNKKTDEGVGEDEGEKKEGEDEAAEVEEEETPDDPLTVLKEKIGLDTAIENLILIDATGQPVAALPMLAGVDYKTVDEGAITSFDKKIKIPDPNDPEAEPIEKTEKWSRFRVCIPGRSPRKGFFFDIDVRFEDEFYSKSWRRK